MSIAYIELDTLDTIIRGGKTSNILGGEDMVLPFFGLLEFTPFRVFDPVVGLICT